ncbi:hypothetical protein [Amycolatopsis sp.]|uniref:hypothetical protein n=1 Tax=Amycolatopsis sp. TaxID=37632 RepID=UPI002DFCF668|nr:hypothetical protein [Amycolatopsis sp.]
MIHRSAHLAAAEEGFYRNAFNHPSATELLLEPGGQHESGEVALCGIDPLTQIDHSTLKTRAAADAVLIVDGIFAFRPEINHHWDLDHPSIANRTQPNVAGRPGS